MKQWWRVLRYFRGNGLRLGFVLALMLGGTAASLLEPWPVALVVDHVLGFKPWPEALAWGRRLSAGECILLAAGVVLVLHILHGLLGTAYNYLSIKIGLGGLRRVRNEVFAALQRFSWRFFQSSSTGDLIYRATWDTYAFQTVFQQGLVGAMTALISLGLMLVVMLRLNVLLTLVALGTTPLLLVCISLFGRRMRERVTAAQQADSRVTSLVQQNIAALPVIQTYNQEAREEARFTAQTLASQEKRLAQHGWELLYNLGMALVFGLGIAAIIYVGSGQVLAGKLTVGELLIFIAYLAQLYEPLRQLSQVGATISTARASTQRVFEIIDAPEDVKDAPNARRVLKPGTVVQGGNAVPLMVRGEIALEGVSFSYQQDCPVLSDVTFTVPAGKAVAIIGPSGAGKTTLLRMVPRFYDPAAGTVRLDGVDLRDLRLEDLRAQVAVVFQESILLPGTVAENIALGWPEASQAQIEAAARAAGAHDFIQRLPNKYDTVVGEGAARLSVGEAQRIGLARAFLKDAPILLLDEPTSALDEQSERQIVASLAELMRGRTTLIVAHRLSTIRGVDRIAVLDNGKVLEEGSPEELLRRRDSYYARLAGAERG
jgi:ATP-binding cassette, subfamily B, bacterial